MSATRQRVLVLGGLSVAPATRLTGLSRRLLAHLAVRGPVESRALVCAELWPDVTDERARANLRRALWQLPDGWAVVDGPDLVLVASVDMADAGALARRAVGGDLLSLGEVDALSRDLLPGWYEEWMVVEQERFRQLRVHALELACHTAARAGDHATAIHAGLAAVAADPLRETGVLALVEAHLREGNRVDAVRRFRAYAKLLQEELGVAPGPALCDLVRDLVAIA